MSKRLSTKQKLFNKVWKAITKQGVPSVNPYEPADRYPGYMGTPACAYSGQNGLRCAAGHLFTKKELTAIADEGKNSAGLTELIDSGLITRPEILENRDLVMDMQDAHDDCSNEDDFIRLFHAQMRHIAENHFLEVPE